MKRTFSARPAGLLLAAGLAWLAGCATYDGQVMPGPGLNGAKHFFVLSNQNDNHAIDQQIVAALKIRGNDVDAGPLTMMPDDSQVIISYEDNWEWDFGDHLISLRLTARDRRSDQPLATVRFLAKIPRGKATPAIVGELVERLLANRKP